MEVTMPLKPDEQGYSRQKVVRGSYEFREYQIPVELQDLAFNNLMDLLPTAGFKIKYSSSPSTITARKDNIWVLINVDREFYNVSVVTATEGPWTPVKDADEISQQMAMHSRVSIYGIEFSPDNQSVVEEHSKILYEVLKYLQEHPALAVIVEGHKMSPNGNEQTDLEISDKRARAVIAWLGAHGIVPGRLQAKALGRSQPRTENDTPLEVQQNERIELAQSPSRENMSR